MKRAILIFDDVVELQQALDAGKWESVLWDFCEQWLRPKWKWGDGPDADFADKAREELHRLMAEYGVEFSD